MAKLIIKGCVSDGSDPDRVIDAVYGDGFRLRMDRAIELALGGVEFWAKMHGPVLARVSVHKSVSGNYFLKTHPDAWVANNLGHICSDNNLSRLARRSLAVGFGNYFATPQNALALTAGRRPFLASLAP